LYVREIERIARTVEEEIRRIDHARAPSRLHIPLCGSQRARFLKALQRSIPSHGVTAHALINDGPKQFDQHLAYVRWSGHSLQG
jgi:hypothetical protein